jgi:Uma2 family endonuclease
MATTRALLTHADLHRLRGEPQDRRRFELVDGELLVVAAPPPWHQLVSGDLRDLMRAEARRLGVAVKVYPAPTALYLDPSPEGNETQPDLIVELADAPLERYHHPRSGWALVGTPWMVVEILSTSTRAEDLGKKRRAYARAGVAVYAVVDLGDQRVDFYTSPAPAREEYAAVHTFGRGQPAPFLGGALDLSQLPWDEAPPGAYD